MTRCATIRSTGRYLPEIEVSNDELRRQLAHVPDFVDKMEAGTGIRRRWYAPAGWATSDLALPAARQALERAGRAPEDVDLIILGTDSPDYITPATSVPWPPLSTWRTEPGELSISDLVHSLP